MKQLGLIPGLMMIILGAMVTESSIDMILRFGKASKSAMHSGIVADAFGGPGCTLLQVCIVINNLGTSVVYMIIIGDVLAGTWSDDVHHSGIMDEWFGQHWCLLAAACHASCIRSSYFVQARCSPYR